MNLYAYVYNDPMNFTDPSGRHGKGNVIPTNLRGLTAEQVKEMMKEEKSKPKNQQDKKKIKDLEKALKGLGERDKQKRRNLKRVGPKGRPGGGGRVSSLITLTILAFEIYDIYGNQSEAGEGSVTVTDLPSDDSDDEQSSDDNTTKKEDEND